MVAGKISLHGFLVSGDIPDKQQLRQSFGAGRGE